MKRVILMVLCGVMILVGCGHDPNRGVDVEKAKAAADRVHAPPDPSVKMEPGHGG